MSGKFKKYVRLSEIKIYGIWNMLTFRKLIGNINVTKNSGHQSSLEQWFESVIDTPIDKLSVGDLCRAFRQDLCVEQLMSRALAVLNEDPLAGESYDGELIAAISAIKSDELKNNMDISYQIKEIINKLNESDIDSALRKDVLKLNNIGV